MPRYIEPREMEEVFWWVDYSDGSYLCKYEPDEQGRWISHSFHEIDQRRVVQVRILRREPGSIIFGTAFAFPFHPETMKLILFYRTEVDMDISGMEKARRRYLYFGFQYNVNGRGYKVMWAMDRESMKAVIDDRRGNLSLTPGG